MFADITVILAEDTDIYIIRLSKCGLGLRAEKPGSTIVGYSRQGSIYRRDAWLNLKKRGSPRFPILGRVLDSFFRPPPSMLVSLRLSGMHTVVLLCLANRTRGFPPGLESGCGSAKVQAAPPVTNYISSSGHPDRQFASLTIATGNRPLAR